MSRARQLFRATDVTKAIKAVVAAGVVVGRVEIDTTAGKIVVVVAGDQEQNSGTEVNEWDTVK